MVEFACSSRNQMRGMAFVIEPTAVRAMGTGRKRWGREAQEKKEQIMSMILAATPLLLAQALPALVWWALIFFIIAIVAFVLGARGVAGFSAGIGRLLLFVFLVLAIIFAIIGFVSRGP